MKRWKITIEYDGRPYSGFQKQPNVPTVQGEIENAIYKFCQQKIDIVAAGRTDAGVHARGQVAHFDLNYKTVNGKEREISGFDLCKAINAHLALQPISIVDAQITDNDFHARFGAKQKHYMYRIVSRPYGLALDQGMAWWVKKDLSVTDMQAGAKHLIGEHDFTTFRDGECQAKSPIRSIDTIDIESSPILNGHEIWIHVRGQAFLHHMVRNIAGTLSYVGQGKWTADDVKTALESKDRTKGGPTAPSDGLYLQSIKYTD
jgi:tRNA pseudouridine38-40 synthase